MMTVHRHTEQREIYFVSNRQDRAAAVTVRVRLSGMAPELWRAEDGSVTPINYSSDANGVTFSLHLKPYDAVFVVFQHSPRKSQAVPQEQVADLQTLSGPWNVHFEAGRGAPPSSSFSVLKPWNESPEPGIKYFSGHATYTQTITVPASAMQRHARVLLDLGEVHEVAEVSINDSAPIIVWHGPYVADVTHLLRPGLNHVAITVTNLWPNRLIGDKQPGATTYTYAPQSPYRANSQLLPSGLLGPVRLQIATTKTE